MAAVMAFVTMAYWNPRSPRRFKHLEGNPCCQRFSKKPFGWVMG
jgi:hypothetical protein